MSRPGRTVHILSKIRAGATPQKRRCEIIDKPLAFGPQRIISFEAPDGDGVCLVNLSSRCQDSSPQRLNVQDANSTYHAAHVGFQERCCLSLISRLQPYLSRGLLKSPPVLMSEHGSGQPEGTKCQLACVFSPVVYAGSPEDKNERSPARPEPKRH